MNRKITIKVKPGSLKRSIETFGSDRYLIKTTETDNAKVNEDILFMLSKYTGTPQHRLRIIAGINSDDKIITIE
ncbi:DUF167 domain-containing protein [Candidatus Pacearchaeota archaeon]|nr:DUF167 domain-containing protein [Candidatus Pacearchaeota archaeon]